MTIVNEMKIKAMSSSMWVVGPTTNQGKNIGRLLRKKVAMVNLLDERALWVVMDNK
jgi:hypothetical protein